MVEADGASATTTIRRPGSPGGISTTIRRPGPLGGNSAVVAIISRAGRRLYGQAASTSPPWRSRGGNSCLPLPGDRRGQGGPRRTRALPLQRSALTRSRSRDRANATSASEPFPFLAEKTKCTFFIYIFKAKPKEIILIKDTWELWNCNFKSATRRMPTPVLRSTTELSSHRTPPPLPRVHSEETRRS